MSKKNRGMKFEDIQVGQTAELYKTFTDAEVKAYAEISGDFNPIHLDQEYASTTRFKKRIVHGMLAGSLFSNLLGTHLPGQGTIYLKQEMVFKAPVYLGQEVRAQVKVIEKREDKKIIKLETRAFTDDQQLVIDGFALVMLMEGP